ncbi:hypothetical protein [Pseudomonas sp. DSV-1]|nr:hypothetical protein [Pseudomonas sp. DSV-1]MEC4238005.1 hypothetical protein [Pseudomonas sp. DSV-1]
MKVAAVVILIKKQVVPDRTPERQCFFLKQKKAAMVAAFETISHMLGK